MSLGASAVAAASGYLLGSIPWGLLLLRLRGGPDPRTVGSGNIGATNVTRAGGRVLGAATLALDAAKAALPVAVAARFSVAAASAAGLAAVIGHCFPVWLGFRGGKGVATVLGAAGALVFPWALVVFLVAWALALVVTRYVAIASVAATWTTPLVALATGAGAAPAGALAAAAVIVTARHRANLRRLRAGTENRVLRSRHPDVAAGEDRA